MMSKNDDFSIVLTPSKLNETGELLILDDYEESFQTTDEDDYLVCSDTVKKENKKACSDNAQSGREFTTKITTDARLEEDEIEPETHVLEDTKCCSLKCMQNVHAADKLDARRSYSLLSVTCKTQWILDSLRIFCPGNSNKSKIEDTTFIIAGIPVCIDAFRQIYGISKSKFYQVYQMYKNGYKVISPKKKRVRIRSQLKTNIAVGWMRVYFKRIGEKMPNSISINLPCYLTKEKVYSEMKRDLEESGDPCCGFSWFSHIWNERFSNVHLPAEDRMSMCPICTILKEEREKTNDRNIREYLDKLYDEHSKLQMEQRENYYKHRAKAKRDPDKYMSLIIDAMDHSKLLLPRFMRKSKETSQLAKLRCHLTAILDHGKATLAYLDMFQWPHDSNYTINTLLSALERREKLPDVLYLQMDNCWRENKNQFVISFLALLILLGVFKKIRISFLMVGHTHEDIDQFFSRIKVWLVKHNLLALSEFIDLIRQSYTMNPGEDRDSGKKKKKLDSDQIKIKPEVFMVRGIFDVKSWMTPVREHLHGIIYPHYFKLFKGENGDVEMKYKNWCSDRWFPETDDGNPGSLVVLKANVILKGEPEQIFPSEEQQELPKLKKDIKQYFKSSTLFGEVVKEEWRNFLTPDSSHFEMNNTDWPLADIVRKKQQQKKKEEEKRQSTANLSAQLFPDMPRPEGLSEVAETRVAAQRDPLPLVYTGPYQAGIHNAVAEVDDHLAKLAPGCMVAVLLANYNMDIPYLGQVLGVNGDEFEIHYWKGSYNKEWEPHMLRVREGKSWKTTPYTDTLPTTCVILCGFEFENNKLTKFYKQYLKEKLAEESRKRKRITLDSQGDQQGEHRNAKKPKQ